MIARFAKAWAALVAGVLVVLGAGLITGNAEVWISTGIAAVGAVLAVLVGPANAPKLALPPPAPAAANAPAVAIPDLHVHVHTATDGTAVLNAGTAEHVQTFTAAPAQPEPPEPAAAVAELRGGGHYSGR